MGGCDAASVPPAVARLGKNVAGLWKPETLSETDTEAVQHFWERTVMSDELNRAIALRWATEGWGTQPRWEQVYDELMARDCVQYFCSGANPILGLAANKEFDASLFAGFPKIEQQIETLIAEGEMVMMRHTLRGQNTGIFMGNPATEKWVENITGFNQFRIVNGKIQERWYETNLLEVMRQLEL
jgi:predicted ester cyclase